MHHVFIWILTDVKRQKYMINLNGNEILPSLTGAYSVLKKLKEYIYVHVTMQRNKFLCNKTNQKH